MAGAYKTPSNRKRGKAGKWTGWYIDADGRKRTFTGTTDKTTTLEDARKKEADSYRIRSGLTDRGEVARMAAASRPLAAHIADYRLDLLAQSCVPKHAQHVAGAVARLLADAAVTSVADLAPDRIQSALGRMRQLRSPRTCNHAHGAVKAFAQWLFLNNRINEVPRGLLKIPKFNEAVGRERVRRALTADEVARLLAATEASTATVPVFGPTRSKYQAVEIDGRHRAILYRLALGTGFRADELRSLKVGWFHLEGDEPSITIPAEHTKNGKPADQPIGRDLAARLKPFIDGRDPGAVAFAVPEKTAKMLAHDLIIAGIPAGDPKIGIVDFHSCRHTYVTNLVRSGVNIKIAQELARHSTPTLTLGIYAHTEAADKRRAVEGEGSE